MPLLRHMSQILRHQGLSLLYLKNSFLNPDFLVPCTSLEKIHRHAQNCERLISPAHVERFGPVSHPSLTVIFISGIPKQYL